MSDTQKGFMDLHERSKAITEGMYHLVKVSESILIDIMGGEYSATSSATSGKTLDGLLENFYSTMDDQEFATRRLHTILNDLKVLC